MAQGILKRGFCLQGGSLISNDRSYWDNEAETFDEAADHGLLDPAVRKRWGAVLDRCLPSGAAALDIGCGTGSLSLLLAERGFAVTGIDASPRMIELARAKAERVSQAIDFRVGDAVAPDLPTGSVDVVLGRHILWALPDTADALYRWSKLLRPGGHLVLIEGFWHTQLGLHQRQVEAALPKSVVWVGSENLAADPLLWGGAVKDERFVVVARLA